MSSLKFREVCDLTCEVVRKSSADIRTWLFAILISVDVKASLFDETTPDRASQARLSQMSPLAERVMTEVGRFNQCQDLDLIGTVAGMLDALSELKKCITDPRRAAAAEPAFQDSHQSLGQLYRVIAGLPDTTLRSEGEE